jgi:hypothetical protein
MRNVRGLAILETNSIGRCVWIIRETMSEQN